MAVKCERPKLSDLGLTTNDSSVFYCTQWTTWPWVHYPFVLYRIVIALYMLGMLLATTIGQIQQIGGQTFLYLTNLALIVVAVYLLVGAFIAWLDGVILRSRNHEVMGIRHRIHWFLFSITININLIVTIVYWSLLYSPSYNGPSFFDFNVHATPAIISTLDLFVTAIPVRLLHFVYPLVFGIAYVVMTVIFWAAGGRTAYGPIYPILDYTNDPGLAAGVICGVMVLCLVLQGALWCLYKLRMWVWMKCREGFDNEELNIIEAVL
ncbi:protein rolling stone-like [Patiria miniata]|uniref:Rolling stone n=1 Tax=Patiria miniata TaxID=46514 RepID=A0A914A4D2_PATMI|nr:protein rolling stone-like [Patiria miniata]